MTHKRILSLDPSSTCTGYAVLDDTAVLDAGLIKGTRAAPLLDRLTHMIIEVRDLFNQYAPTDIIIEVPTGKQYTRRPGYQSGLAVWAFAAGTIYGYARTLGVPVHGVSNVEWTRGYSKEKRRLAVQAGCKSYDPQRDKGGDVADAIALAWWWLSHLTTPQNGA